MTISEILEINYMGIFLADGSSTGSKLLMPLESIRMKAMGFGESYLFRVWKRAVRVKQRKIDKVEVLTIVTCKGLTANILTAKLVQSDSKMIRSG